MNKQIVCYKCKSPSQLMVEEKRDAHTGNILEKNFICLSCSGVTFLKEPHE